MEESNRTLSLRSARNAKSSAKLHVLQAQASRSSEFQGKFLTFAAMRIYIESGPGFRILCLVPVAGGYALYLQLSRSFVDRGELVWLVAERSKRIRVFKRAETAFAVCKSLQANEVRVLLDREPNLKPSL